jgi:serine/threonine-protein kinase
VVKVFDVGKLEQGMPFMVMELLIGSTLARLVDTRGPLPIPEALDYIMQTLVAVAECQRAGIVHRDLKPENIMVSDTDRVKIVDFGLAKLKPPDGPEQSQAVTQSAAASVARVQIVSAQGARTVARRHGRVQTVIAAVEENHDEILVANVGEGLGHEWVSEQARTEHAGSRHHA